MAEAIDTVVIGGSAGSLAAVRKLVSLLPTDIDACLIVVIHRGDAAADQLAELIGRSTELTVKTAEDGDSLEAGHVLVAPCDCHVLIGEGHLHLRRGPAENGFRPAIDPLFRSAALYRAAQTIAVILSGYLDDGASGMSALGRLGAHCLVQSAEEADVPSMPTAALQATPGAEELSVQRIAERIAELVGQPASEAGPVPETIVTEVSIAAMDRSSIEKTEGLGTLTPFNCPDCNGVLWQIEDGTVTRYRCHTGHAYTIDILSAKQEEAVERALYDTLRAQRGRVELLEELAERSKGGRPREYFLSRARRYEEDSQLIEKILSRRAS